MSEANRIQDTLIDKLAAFLHELQANGSMPPRGALCDLLWECKAALSTTPDSSKLAEAIKDMAVAHEMSHEPYCDGSDWKDCFQDKYAKALALAGSSEISVMGEDKAVNKSRGGAKTGTTSEAAGLEPECDRPSPTQQPDEKREAFMEWVAQEREEIRKRVTCPQKYIGIYWVVWNAAWKARPMMRELSAEEKTEAVSLLVKGYNGDEGRIDALMTPMRRGFEALLKHFDVTRRGSDQ